MACVTLVAVGATLAAKCISNNWCATRYAGAVAVAACCWMAGSQAVHIMKREGMFQKAFDNGVTVCNLMMVIDIINIKLLLLEQ